MKSDSFASVVYSSVSILAIVNGTEGFCAHHTACQGRTIDIYCCSNGFCCDKAHYIIDQQHYERPKRWGTGSIIGTAMGNMSFLIMIIFFCYCCRYKAREQVRERRTGLPIDQESPATRQGSCPQTENMMAANSQLSSRGLGVHFSHPALQSIRPDSGGRSAGSEAGLRVPGQHPPQILLQSYPSRIPVSYAYKQTHLSNEYAPTGPPPSYEAATQQQQEMQHHLKPQQQQQQHLQHQ